MLHDAARDDAELRELARLQRGLQRLIAPSARVETDGESGAAADEAARAIGCDAERIAIYRRMGEQRFANEVAREFPATRALLGAARFQTEARAFVRETASASYTLDGYARAFSSHLLRAARSTGDEALAGAAELARLECESARTSRAKPQRAVRAVSLPRALARSSDTPRLRAARGARLLRLGIDALALLEAFERGETLPHVARTATHVALFQHERRVVRLRIARGEAPALTALLRGDALEAAVARALAAGLTPGAVGDALEHWVSAGLVTLARG